MPKEYQEAVQFFVHSVGRTTFYFWWDKRIRIAIEHGPSKKVYTGSLRYYDLCGINTSELLIVASKLLGSRKREGPELYALLAMASVALADIFFGLWRKARGPLRLSV